MSERCTAEEVIEMSEEEGQGKVTTVGHGFAFPGDSTSVVLQLDEPGRHAVYRFVPEGRTPEAAEEFEAGGAEPDGPPHAALGKWSEFTVE
jgi:hypothetical protein